MTFLTMRRISLVVAILGLLCILISVPAGEGLAWKLTAQRTQYGYGVYDTATLHFRRDAIITNFRIVGAVLLGVGLLRALQSGRSDDQEIL